MANQNYANIGPNGVVIEVFMEVADGLKLTELYNQTVSQMFTKVPDNVAKGWKVLDGGWQAPDPFPIN